MSLAMPAANPVDTVVGVAYHLLRHVAAALAPIDGGLAAVIAIVVVTAGVRLLLVPLSLRQIKAQQAQARLAPKLKELQAAHRNDRTRLLTETAELYRREGASPFSALLPALLQAPVVYALYAVFTRPTLNGRPNELLTADLLGYDLAAHGVAAGWPLLAVLAAIALVATLSARRIRRAGQPAWLRVLPYLTLIPAMIMPMAAGFYLLTTVTWSAAETALLRREPSP